MSTPSPDQVWITFCFARDNSSLKILKEELENNDEINWYIPTLLKHSHSNTIDIIEDKRTVMMIIESMRHSRLILYEDIELGYLKVLADKWCLPDWFTSELDDIIQERNSYNSKRFSNFQEYLENQILKCVNCRSGFKLSENTDKSCGSHRDFYSAVSNKMKCCGAETFHSSYCQIGFHVPNIEEIESYKKLYQDLRELELKFKVLESK